MNEVKSKLQNVEIYSSITTNGYLLDISSFSELLKSGVKYFQVTIDGTKEVHDASRYLRNHEGTYDVIMKNLEDISALPHDVIFNMDIRSNFRKSTFASVNDFLDVYIKKFGNDPRFHAYCRPVYYYETKDGEIDSMVSDLYSLEEGIEKQNMLSEKIVRFSAEKIAHRIFDPLPQPTDYWCNAEAHNHAIVGPEGELYICDTMTGEKYVKGNIKNDDAIKGKSSLNYNIFNDARTAKCMNCKRLPICMGNCMRNRLESEAKCYWSDDFILKALKRYDDQMCIHANT